MDFEGLDVDEDALIFQGDVEDLEGEILKVVDEIDDAYDDEPEQEIDAYEDEQEEYEQEVGVNFDELEDRNKPIQRKYTQKELDDIEAYNRAMGDYTDDETDDTDTTDEETPIAKPDDSETLEATFKARYSKETLKAIDEYNRIIDTPESPPLKKIDYDALLRILMRPAIVAKEVPPLYPIEDIALREIQIDGSYIRAKIERVHQTMRRFLTGFGALADLLAMNYQTLGNRIMNPLDRISQALVQSYTNVFVPCAGFKFPTMNAPRFMIEQYRNYLSKRFEHLAKILERDDSGIQYAVNKAYQIAFWAVSVIDAKISTEGRKIATSKDFENAFKPEVVSVPDSLTVDRALRNVVFHVLRFIPYNVVSLPVVITAAQILAPDNDNIAREIEDKVMQLRINMGSETMKNLFKKTLGWEGARVNTGIAKITEIDLDVLFAENVFTIMYSQFVQDQYVFRRIYAFA